MSTIQQLVKKFVYLKKSVILESNVEIQSNAVGIIEEASEDVYTVFFIREWQRATIIKNLCTLFDVSKTGDQFTKKVCNVCHRLLNTTSFDKNQNGKNNRTVRRPSCHDCRAKIDGVSMTSKVKKEWALTKPKNIPFECPICNKRTIAGVTCKVVLDHNHHDGSARGWVCDSCNTGIGRFKDDPLLINRALKFIS